MATSPWGSPPKIMELQDRCKCLEKGGPDGRQPWGADPPNNESANTYSNWHKGGEPSPIKMLHPFRKGSVLEALIKTLRQDGS